MGINLKDKFQNLNKKRISIILLIVILFIVAGLGIAQYISGKQKAKLNAKRIEQIEQQAKLMHKQQNEPQPKKPSEYTVGMDYNDAIKGHKPILVLFYADWCGYCIRFMPIYEEISKKYDGDILLAKVNVEDEKYQQLVREMEIMGFPTVFIIDPKYDNKVLIGNNHLGSVESLGVEIDRFVRIRKLLDGKK